MFVIRAYTGGLLRIAKWDRPVVIDLKGLRARLVTILRNHDFNRMVGQGQAEVRESEVIIRGRITGDVTNPADPAYDIMLHARNGFIWPASVGASVERAEKVEAGATAVVNGRTFGGPLYIARAGRLGETSLLGVGADEDAYASIAARAAGQK